MYDACVLYPAPLRDFLMQLATTGLFRAAWTEQIHEEWIESLLANRPDLTRTRLERTKNLMDASVPDSLIVNYEELVPGIDLPDQNDRHVVAAAIRGGASLIVTFNLNDFPASILGRYDLEAVDPDDFIVQQFHLSEARVIESARKHRARLKSPRKTVEEYLATLDQQRLPRTAALLKSHRFYI